MRETEYLLTKTIRRIIMMMFVMIFLLTTPLLILYTAGYRYDWKMKTIKQTGVISIDVLPKDAEVSINGVIIRKAVPIRLTNMAPGTYHIRIAKQGFKTWEKDIAVESKQTAFVKDITLYRESLPAAVYSGEAKSIENIYPSADGRYALFVNFANGVETIELFDAETETATPVSRAKQDQKSSIQWSPSSALVFVARPEDGGTVLRLIDAANPDRGRTFVSKGHELGHIQWPISTEGDMVYIEKDGVIYRVSIADDSRMAIVTENKIWHVDENRNVWFLDRRTRRLETSDPAGSSVILLPDLPVQYILDINEHRALLKSANGLVIVQRNQENSPREIAAGHVFYNPHTKEWLAWSPWELWSIYDNGHVESLNRTGQAMRSVQPLTGTGELLIVTSEKIQVFNPGYFITQDLFPGNVISAYSYQKKKRVYMLGSVAERFGFYVLEL